MFSFCSLFVTIFTLNLQFYFYRNVTVKGKMDTNSYPFEEDKRLFLFVICLNALKKQFEVIDQPFEQLAYPLKKISIRSNGLPVHSKNLASVQTAGLSVRKKLASVGMIFVSVHKLEMLCSKSLNQHPFKQCSRLSILNQVFTIMVL